MEIILSFLIFIFFLLLVFIFYLIFSVFLFLALLLFFRKKIKFQLSSWKMAKLKKLGGILHGFYFFICMILQVFFLVYLLYLRFLIRLHVIDINLHTLSIFSCMFLNPNFFSNCSNLYVRRNLQEQVKKAFCYQKLFWPFTVWINCSSDLKMFLDH